MMIKKWIWKDAVVAYVGRNPGIWLEWLRKKAKSLRTGMDRPRRVKSVICKPDSWVKFPGPWQGLITDLKITNRDSEIPVMQMAYFRFNFGTRVAYDRRDNCALFADRRCRVVRVTDPYSRILGFLDRSSYFFFQVARQLYSRGWVVPVPDPLLLRKCGSTGNRARTSGSVARNSDTGAVKQELSI
jgi:hypothetical protein